MSSVQLPNVTSADLLAAHLQEIIIEYESYKKQYRRSDAREPVSIPVEAMELDEQLQVKSEPFHMVTRDMSVAGTGIFHNRRVDCDFLLLKFSSPVTLESFSVVAKVEHCTPCGRYFIVGCRFVPDLVDELRS